jgi:hypothetical protein
MSKKIYLFILGISVAIFLIIIGIAFVNKNQMPAANISEQVTNKTEMPTQPPYTIEDTANAPKSKGSMAQGVVVRESNNANHEMQRFTIKSSLDGSIREIFAVNENDITFEKITEQNWSPTNKFLYVYIDYPQRRDVIFIKTDGRFTNGSYYLHSTGLYPDINVLNTKWVDGQTLELQTKDIKTNQPQGYIVSFDDDSGIVSPELK